MGEVQQTFRGIDLVFNDVESPEEIESMFQANPDSIYIAVIFEEPPESTVRYSDSSRWSNSDPTYMTLAAEVRDQDHVSRLCLPLTQR